jgi:hypothetical protein
MCVSATRARLNRTRLASLSKYLTGRRWWSRDAFRSVRADAAATMCFAIAPGLKKYIRALHACFGVHVRCIFDETITLQSGMTPFYAGPHTDTGKCAHSAFARGATVPMLINLGRATVALYRRSQASRRSHVRACIRVSSTNALVRKKRSRISCKSDLRNDMLGAAGVDGV